MESGENWKNEWRRRRRSSLYIVVKNKVFYEFNKFLYQLLDIRRDAT